MRRREIANQVPGVAVEGEVRTTLLTRQTDHTPHRKGSRFWAGPGANDVNGAVEKGRWRYIICSGSHEGLVS